ncbi:MAG: prepilin-type N-terminal cleavage/methylation domain-containing protein [Patescibacteria group bacterium]
MKFKFSKIFLGNNQRGFSLMELLVTIAILMVVSGLVFFNQSQFNNSTLIENLAYEMSLAIRQAQSFGLQVKGIGADFDNGYGVYFEKDSDEFLIFSDTYPVTPNFVYDDGYDEIIDRLKMTNKNRIDYLCIDENCLVDTLNISFKRPNPNAIIKVDDSGTEGSEGSIHIISPKGLEKNINVNGVGQIYIGS